MKCNCGGRMKPLDMYAQGEMVTLVSYYSPPGHDHDDNCRTKVYTCEDCGKDQIISKRNYCPSCEWIGKEKCFCHPGKKVDEWPE